MEMEAEHIRGVQIYTHVRADSKYNQLCTPHYITIGPMAPLLEVGSPTATSSFISLGGLAAFLILTALRSAVSCGHGSAVARQHAAVAGFVNSSILLCTLNFAHTTKCVRNILHIYIYGILT